MKKTIVQKQTMKKIMLMKKKRTMEKVKVVNLVHMMADSLMSSDQILAHQSPTVKKFWKESLEVKSLWAEIIILEAFYLWETWVPLQGIHRTKVRPGQSSFHSFEYWYKPIVYIYSLHSVLKENFFGQYSIFQHFKDCTCSIQQFSQQLFLPFCCRQTRCLGFCCVLFVFCWCIFCCCCFICFVLVCY